LCFRRTDVRKSTDLILT